jgi:A/G-specific adenine glycosylase
VTIRRATAAVAEAALAEGVLAWSAVGWRDLPWRRTRDPWAVLVSELMLQQTQVARVVPKWEAFVARWPTPAACAAASPDEVVRAWAGLGYNRRALNLHRCATAVVERHAGSLPDDFDALRALPGVGPYTARAVLAFAFGRDVGVLDVNTARVVARSAAGRPVPPTELQRIADALVPSGRGWEWNQAVLDLGAQVCTARTPRCDRCPIRSHCAWRVAGGPDPVPQRTPQGRFEGSDRQGRGRLLDALRRAPVDPAELSSACGWPDDEPRARRIVEGLVADGFVGRNELGELILRRS